MSLGRSIINNVSAEGFFLFRIVKHKENGILLGMCEMVEFCRKR